VSVVPIMHMPKTLFVLLALFTLGGCLERKIYTEINEPSYIAHPPKSLRIDDISGIFKNTLKSDPSSPVVANVYIHCSQCTNAQSKSLGADFDGYIRITIKDNNTSIARAQMDYKGEATREDVQQVYDYLIKKLNWK
jgi:hypothetical protein